MKNSLMPRDDLATALSALTPFERQHMERLMNNQASPVTFEEFQTAIHPEYEHMDYTRAIDNLLDQALTFIMSGGREGLSRIIISIPPQHGKSDKVARKFPTFAYGVNPMLNTIITSYDQELVEGHSRYIRDNIRGPVFQSMFRDIEMNPNNAGVKQWSLLGYGGGLRAASIGSGITGFGANLIIIDDPHKNRAEADSEAERNRIYRWYKGTLYHRQQFPCVIIIIAHRWHPDDLIGRLTDDAKNDPEADQWHYLRLPALAEDNDPIGRDVGEPLWKTRRPRRFLLKQQHNMGAYDFQSLYQGKPFIEKGAMFDVEQLRIIDEVPLCKRVVRYYDLALGRSKRADYTVGVKMGLADAGRIIVLDVFRVRYELPEVQEAIVANAYADGTGVPIVLEGEKAGLAEFQYLMRDDRMMGFVIETESVSGGGAVSKYVRAGPFASRVNAGMVDLVRASWNSAFIDELRMFSQEARTVDDQVDASSGAYRKLDNSSQIKMGRMRRII